MQRSFVANLAFILVINLIIKPLYVFGVEVNVQNVLGADQYGLFFALLNTAYLLQIINDFGLQIFHVREVAIDRGQLSELLPGLSLIKLFFAFVYLILLTALGYLLGYQGFLWVLALIGVNLILTSFVLFLRSGISGLGYYRIDSALSVVDKLLMILLIGGMLLFLPASEFSIYHFVLGQTVAFLLTVFIAWMLIRYYGTFTFTRLPLRHLRKLAGQALPYALVIFLMTLYTRSDGVMLKALLPDGDFEAGVYAAGYRILDAVNIVALLFAVMLLPMFSKTLKSENELSALLNEGVRYMTVFAVPVCAFALIFHNQIVFLLYTEATPYWGLVFALLMATVISTAIMYIFSTLLTAAGRLKSMNYIYAGTVGLNIVLNFLLIPGYKAAGAAIATVITQFVAATAITLLCFRLIRIRIAIAYTYRLFVFVVVCFGGYWLTDLLVGLDQWFISLPLMGIITLLSAAALRFFTWSDFRSLFVKR